MKNGNIAGKLRITVGNHRAEAVLYENQAARDFIDLLPLKLTLADYAHTEKVADLPRRLNTSREPAGYKPSIGDITYYAPWGNLAIFYKGFSYSGGLVSLGKIEAGLDCLTTAGNQTVSFELITNTNELFDDKY